jgi:hypothetical protein
VNLIYQQWAGKPKRSAFFGSEEMAAYAARIGATHRFVRRFQPHLQLGEASKYWDKLLPLWDGSCDDADNLMIADTDLFPVSGMSASIFETFIGEIGMCTEPLQPALRAGSAYGICRDQDERWARMVEKEWGGRMPRDKDGALKVYNAGLIMLSREGLQLARKLFVAPQQYIDACARHKVYKFYALDQNYMHAMAFSMGLKMQELDNKWNCYVHYLTRAREIVGVIDPRTPQTRMVHVQLRGADDYDDRTLHRIVNLPQAQWRLP